ncbi:stage V sporulation protein B (plasmid) [Acetobacter orientalis]|uniref:Stage V sporulation protein B n=1 Tax=Acetobacter orientalis TaxID=146474 RepID=A0A2Z5ZMQ7_9PROT|nr:stage V sporulation protein B [Acetobacter orientalis]
MNLTHAGLSFVLGAALELCSLTLLAYVPYTVETKEGA